MNECWQEEPAGGGRLEDEGEKSRGKGLEEKGSDPPLARGDTLASCMRCRGYQSSARPAFLCVTPPQPDTLVR